MTLPAFMNLFPEFRAASWDGWKARLAGLTDDVRELFVVAGRGSGKSRIASVLACWFATRRYPLVPGESIYVGIFAPDRRQAAVTFRYVRGLLQSVPELAALIVAETRDSITLRTGVIVEVVTASTAAPRGRSYGLAIIEEAAFLEADEHSANPDVELLRSIRPACARVPGSLLAVISSPYARKGILYQATVAAARPEVLVLVAATADLNPTFDAQAIARAYADDAVSAASEYGAAFRSDIESFIARDVLDALIVPGRHELPPMGGMTYRSFIDPSGGSKDAMCLAIGHTERRGDRTVEILDLLREVRPPFSPDETVKGFAADLRRYRVSVVTGDRYAGEWPREVCQTHGITYRTSERTKSDLYRDFLPIANSGGVELLDHPRLIAQLAGLERRVARGGKDSIDHGPGQHDDLANVVAGATALAAAARRSTFGMAYSPWI